MQQIVNSMHETSEKDDNGDGSRFSLKLLSIPHTFGLSKPVSGGQNRFSHLVMGLTKRGHQVVVLQPANLQGPEDSKFATVYSFEDWRTLGKSLAILRDFNSRFLLALRRILRRENIMMIEMSHPSGMIGLKLLVGGKSRKVPLVYSPQNVEAEFAVESYAANENSSWLERLFVCKYTALIESLVCRYVADRMVVCSTRDREELVERYGIDRSKVTVIPSGAPVLDSIGETDRTKAKAAMGISPESKVVLFHGIHSLHPNRRAVELIANFIAPALRISNPDAQFLIVGSGMPEFTRANVKSLGYLEDLTVALHAADVAIVPLEGGAGVKLKVLDYLGAGLPIVATKKGVEGIDVRNHQEAMIVDSVGPDFVRALAFLLDNENERLRIGSNARLLSLTKHDWETIVDDLESAYLRLCHEYATSTDRRD